MLSEDGDLGPVSSLEGLKLRSVGMTGMPAADFPGKSLGDEG